MTPVIKYMHLRLLNADGYIDQHGGLTVAYKVHNGMVKEFSTAKCNLVDRYNRQDGVLVSTDRMSKGDINRLPFEGIEPSAFRTAVRYAWNNNPKQAYRYSLGTRSFVHKQPTVAEPEEFDEFI